MIMPLRRALRAIGPAVPLANPAEALRAGLGAAVGLGVAGLLLLSPAMDLRLGLYLIAPFGATAVLVFAVPSSPLAQPWSAVVGNTASALVAVAVCALIGDPALRVALAVGLAIAVMILIRALHPPGGAVAMTAALSPEAVNQLGPWFALAPVGAGTLLLVITAAIYARATGRRYPLRQFDEKNSHGTIDPSPPERLGLSEAELTDILSQYRQSLNLGVEDLARLIAAAELQAATHRTGPLIAADIMSRDLVTVGPDATMGEVAEQFRQHGFTSLPVVGPDDRFLGVIFQLHLIRRAGRQAFLTGGRFGAAMSGLLSAGQDAPVRAGQIMSTDTPRATPDTPVAALLPQMAEGSVDAVPVLEGEQIAGIVTRTDLIAALARQSLRAG